MKPRIILKLENFDPKTTFVLIGKRYDFASIVDFDSLGVLRKILGDVIFSYSPITDLGNLTTIGGSVNFMRSKVIDLSNLQTIGGYADFRDSQVKNLGNLTTIGGSVNFMRSKVIDLSNLQTIGGYADFRDSQVKNLGQLTTIEGDAYFQDSKIMDLGNLTTIEGRGIFLKSKVKNLGNLQNIGGNASFVSSKIKDLGILTTIGGDAYFGNSQITHLGNLTTIGGSAFFGEREDLKEEWERRQNKYKKGGRTISQTPAPKKDQIKGSDKNKAGSSKDTESAKQIKFNEKTLNSIQNKVDEHNKQYPNKKITLESAKAVVRRGMGAYSQTYRPTISGGKPNSRVAWGLARLNAFIYKIINGKSKSGKYSQDNDLIEELGYKVQKYSDGGDIQAYEEAMGISYAEGGETKPKKVYVSIKLDNNLEKIPNTFNEYFTNYSEKTFEELKNGVLIGVVGVSSSPNNIAEWFISRDCLIVMNYDEFMAINETETINYYDPYQLMKNNLYLFKRLYANISARSYDEESSYVFTQTLVKILEKMIREINLEMNLAEGQKYSELYRISRFLSPYETKAFPNWIENNKIKIESPIDLTNAILDFNKLNDNWLGNGFPNSVLTFDELLPIVEKGITNASSVYDSEQEIVLNNRKLNVPKNSQLFFVGKDEVGNKRESNKDELIEKYDLKELYKVYFVNAKEIQKYRDFWIKKEEEKFNKKIETGKQDLEIKKSQVTNQLIDYFIQHSIDTVIDKVNKEILSYELGSLEFYDSTKDDYEEMNWVNIPLVNELFSKYTEIVEKSWEEIIENKSVNQVNLYSFNVFQDDANRKLKTYFEQNRDKYEELDDYRNTKGRPSFNLGFLEYDLLKSLNDYQDLPEWIDYKELSKMYLKRMGSEIYRYYDKKDLPLISYYKQGGGVLLAPNGKPSNLTPEQYELVRTPEFKAWFGDWENDPENSSKVIDKETKEPLVVYHGTSADFTIFDTDEESENRKGGTWNAEYPDGYIFMISDKKKAKYYGKRIIPLFVNIVYPIIKKVKKGESLVMPFDDEGLAYEGDAIVTDGIDYVVGTQDEYAVKLADGTNITFDGNNPDIRYTGGGLMKRRSRKRNQ